jgi:hypothetical protein
VVFEYIFKKISFGLSFAMFSPAFSLRLSLGVPQHNYSKAQSVASMEKV